MNPILSHVRVAAEGASPEHWLYFLHGIYGSGRNWASLARRLAEERREWGVILVDLRLHGDSAGFAPPHTVEACAEDLARLEESLGLPATAVLGHSFGGKVALLRAAGGERDLRQVWVADSSLGRSEPSGSAWRIIEIVRGLPERFTSRDEVADALEAHDYARQVGLWLAMNLERHGDSFRWKLDWHGVEAMLRDYYATDVWPIIERPPGETEIHVIRARRSSALDRATLDRLNAAAEATGRVTLHEVDAGHWLNVEDPDAVLDLLDAHLP